MEPTREVLRKAETIVINSQDEFLKDFLGSYYILKNLKDDFEEGSALYYTEELTENEAWGNKCSMLWSGVNVSARVKEITRGKILIEGRSIKEEYIKYFMSFCGA